MLSKLPLGDERLRIIYEERATSRTGAAKKDGVANERDRKIRKKRKLQRKAKFETAKKARDLFEAGNHAAAISLLCNHKNVRINLSQRERNERRLRRARTDLAETLMKICGVVLIQGLFPRASTDGILKAQESFHKK